MDSLELEKIGIEVDEVIPYSMIENYIFDIEELSANKKLFLLMLRRYAGADKKPAFPSYKKLQKVSGSKSPATIMKCIDFFVWLHWLERINRTAEGKEKVSNIYIISLKNMKLVLDHITTKGYNFAEIEKHFEDQYKKPETRKELLSKPCKFLS